MIPIGDVKPPWFYAVSATLGDRSIIEPGNWGRILKLKRNRQPIDQFRWAKEAAYDRARQQLLPKAPSRLACLFVCPRVADARNFLTNNMDRTDLIYEVEPLQELADVCVTDWSLVVSTDFATPYPVAQWQADASRYWKTTAQRHRELLIPCPVRIIRRRDRTV